MVVSTPPTEYYDSDYDSDPDLVDEMIKIEASQPERGLDLDYDSDPEFIEEMIKVEASQHQLDPEIEYDSDPEFFEEMIKIEASQSMLTSTQFVDSMRPMDVKVKLEDLGTQALGSTAPQLGNLKYDKPGLSPWFQPAQDSHPYSLGKRHRASSSLDGVATKRARP